MQQKQAGFALHTVFIIIISIAGVVFIGLHTKNQVEVRAERKQFLAAQKEVNAIGEQIAKATKPNKQQSVAYCDYGHLPFGRGGRTCWTKYYQINLNTPTNQAAILLSDVQDKMKESIKYEVSKYNDANSFPSLNFKSNSIPCSTTLYYKDKDNLAYRDGNLDWDIPDQSSTIVISCSGEAKAEHFLVKD